MKTGAPPPRSTDLKGAPGPAEADAEARPLSGWERRRLRVAEELQTTAYTLFATRGYRQVSIEDVARAAGVSVRTVTRYFPTKEDLVLAAPRSIIRRVVEALDAVELDGRSVAAVWQTCASLAATHVGDIGHAKAWNRITEGAPEILARVQRESRMAMLARLTRLFAQALDTDPEEDVAPHVLAAALEGANRAVMEFWLAREGRDDMRNLFTTAFEALSREVSPSRVRAARKREG